MRILSTLVVAVALISLGASPSQAADGPLQDQINQVLEEFPGGVQTSATTISWDGGAMTLTLANPSGFAAAAVGSCATGAYCAYNGLSLTGSKLSFTSCPATSSTAALPGVVRSIANARSSGSIQGRNSGGTVLTTVAAGGQVNSAPTGVTELRCT